jgi:integrase
VGEYAELWMEELRSMAGKGVSHGTLKVYDWGLRIHLLPLISAFRMRDMGRARWRSVILEKRASQAGGTLATLLACARTLCAAAVRDGIFEANPCAGLGRELHLATMDPDQVKAMERHERDAFLAALEGPYRVALAVMAYTGVRIGECRGLQAGDVLFEERGLRIERQITDVGRIARLKTRAGRRIVDMADALADILRREVAGRGPNDWLFFDGEPTQEASYRVSSGIRREMTATCRRAGIGEHFSPHCLRHTFASLLIQQGEDVHYVAQQLGHRSITTTCDIYARWLRRSQPDAVNRLAEPAITRPVPPRDPRVLPFRRLAKKTS